MLGVELPAGLKNESRDYVLIPENVDVVRLAAAAHGQWRLSPSGHPAGLDYSACEAAAKGLGVKWKKSFAKLLVMEGVMLAEWRDRFSRSPAGGRSGRTTTMRPG